LPSLSFQSCGGASSPASLPKVGHQSMWDHTSKEWDHTSKEDGSGLCRAR
jgi:hypothetical protein